MQYLGGKARISKQLSQYINSRLKPNQPYWEPFVGAGWILQHIDPARQRYASDIHPYLISMWQDLQDGWIPPDYINREEYYRIKKDISNKALHGFTGFACSYSGKWWGGYARNGTDRNYCKNAKNSLLRKLPHVKDVYFFCRDYIQSNPKDPTLIYCDIPYIGTTGYSNKFDHQIFWEWVRKRSCDGHTVLVSEYIAPEDFTCVWEHKTKTDMRVDNKKSTRIERLFEYAG